MSTVSFRALFGNERVVEIPVIQRDYAQGRGDEHSREVRRRFLDALAGALLADDPSAPPLDLDFVYGRLRGDEKTLEPLDGQQRLTTLFLLHWYLACRDGAFAEFQSWMAHPRGGSCFTYRTRPAAREFFDALIVHEAPVGSFPESASALSDWLKDAVWFVRSWRRDPTVVGCLTMLDELHARFVKARGAWARLTSTETPRITFRLLRLEEFELSDDLYVKMNARGRPLTPFEVFKAEAERFAGETFGAEPCRFHSSMSWRDYIAHRFDGVWTDLMWGPLGGSQLKAVDAPLMHLIRALAVVRVVEAGSNSKLLNRVQRLLVTPQPGFPMYEELGVADRTFLEQLTLALDALARNSGPKFLRRSDYLDEASLFERILSAREAHVQGGLTLEDWALFFAWCSFLLRFADSLGAEPTRAAFHDWIRVSSNLVFNSSIDRNERLIAAMDALAKLVESAGAGFLEQVAEGALEKTGGFNQQQIRGEQLKAQLILRHDAWRDLLERAEAHSYFRGDIEFLLLFCGVHKLWTDLGGCKWDDEQDGALRLAFADRYARACAVFPPSTYGVRPFPEFLWERALLATGDYMLPRGKNWSLLDDKDRDTSWKRLLRGDTNLRDHEARRNVVGRVLARIDPANVEGTLRAIVAAGIQDDDARPMPGIRGRLVADPRLLAFCERRMLRLFEDGTAYLLKRAQRNGTHVDLFIYDLYLKLHAERGELAPFTVIHCSAATGSYPPSQLQLSAPKIGLALVVEKAYADFILRMSMSSPMPELASQLGSWMLQGNSLMRRVKPDDAREAVLELAKQIRDL